MPEIDPIAEAEFYSNDEMESLLETPPAEGWQPEDGDSVYGFVTDITSGDVGGYGDYPIVTVQTKDGDVALHCFHTTLKGRIQRALDNGELRLGTQLGVKYFGKVEGGNFSGYENYKVVIRNAAA